MIWGEWRDSTCYEARIKYGGFSFKIRIQYDYDGIQLATGKHELTGLAAAHLHFF